MPFFPEVSVLSRSASEWLNLLYDDREMCAKPAPLGYTISLSVAHLLAAPIYVVAFYTLYSERSRNFRGYKKYLAFHALCNLLFEIHLSVMMQPVLYLPNLVIRFAGFSILRYVNGAITFFIFMLIIVGTLWSIIELFYFRFKSISDSNLCNNWVKNYGYYALSARWCLVFLTFSTLGTLGLAYAVGLFDQAEFKRKLAAINEYPEIQCMSALILPRPTESGLKPIHLFNISCGLSLVVGLSLSGSLCVVSMLALRQMVRQTRSSIKTVNMHRSFLISLVGQISLHLILLGLPTLVYIIAVAFYFDGNEVGYLAIVLASLHGTASTLAMIFLNKPLLNIFISMVLPKMMISSGTRDSSVIISVV